MTEEKKKVGQPKKKEEDKCVYIRHSFLPEQSEFLSRLPKGARSKFIQKSITIHQAILDGKATLVPTEGYEDELQEILK